MKLLASVGNYHVVDVLVRSDLLFESFVQSTYDQVAVVFIFHQFADAIDFEPSDAFTFQHLVHRLSSESMVKDLN